MIFVATQESIGEAPSMRGLDLPGLHDTTNILHTRLVCLFCHGLESITLARLSRLFDVCSAKSLNDGSCLLWDLGCLAACLGIGTVHLH